MDNTIGNRIYKLRTAKGLTQDQLADEINVSRQAISKWERGEGYPDLYNIKILAKALDVSVDELINEDSQDRPNTTEFSEQVKSSGNYIKRLLFKAQHTSNSKEARKIKKTLLLVGGLGVLLGGLLVILGFVGFVGKAFGSFGSLADFNPLPYFLLLICGSAIGGISIYVLVAGLAITVAGATTNFLDTRNKCPKCGDRIDNDEMVCSNCGYDLGKGIRNCSKCGYDNKKDDKYCRKCGQEL